MDQTSRDPTGNLSVHLTGSSRLLFVTTC